MPIGKRGAVRKPRKKPPAKAVKPRPRKRAPVSRRVNKNTADSYISQFYRWILAHRRWLGYFLVLLVFCGLLYAAHVALNNPKVMAINRVEVKGELTHVTREVLEPILKPFIGTNLYLLDAEGLEIALEEEPWIRSAALYKKWPQTLVLLIEEHSPIAYWGEDKMINNKGEVFETVLEEQRGVMPILYSSDRSDSKGFEAIANYKKIQQWVKKLPVGVESFAEDARGAWHLTLTNGIEVEVGRWEQEKRLRRLVIGYLKELANREKRIRKIDLRYTNGFAVVWSR